MVEVGWDLKVVLSNHLLKQGHTEQAAQDRVQTAFEYLQGQRLHSLWAQPAPVLGHPHCENVFTDVQTVPPVFQFVLMASCPVTGHHWKEPAPSFLHPTLSSPPLPPHLFSSKTVPQSGLINNLAFQLFKINRARPRETNLSGEQKSKIRLLKK